jgi:hypothetical protein
MLQIIALTPAQQNNLSRSTVVPSIHFIPDDREIGVRRG